MLVLTRRINETIVIDEHITITVLGMKGSHVRLGINAPRNVSILRAEILANRPANAPPPLLPVKA